MTTDKNKEQFEKWYLKDFMGYKDPRHLEQYKKIELERFYNMPFQMQIGVYLAYYDSLPNMTIEICKTPSTGRWYYMIDDNSGEKEFVNTRNEAYKEAFKKADELINKQLC